MRGHESALRAAALVVLLALPSLAGCYQYEPIDEARPGMDVRARLAAEAAVRRSEGLDEPVVVVNGRVTAATADSLTLAVLLARDPSVFRDVAIHDTVRLAMSEVQAMSVRSVSTGRSLLFAGALGVGGFLIVRGISAIVGGGEGEDPPPPQVSVTPAAQAARAPVLLRVPWPRR
jgi:hypothetical protein